MCNIRALTHLAKSFRLVFGWINCEIGDINSTLLLVLHALIRIGSQLPWLTSVSTHLQIMVIACVFWLRCHLKMLLFCVDLAFFVVLHTGLSDSLFSWTLTGSSKFSLYARSWACRIQSRCRLCWIWNSCISFPVWFNDSNCSYRLKWIFVIV